jgi:hypothetical protein
METTRLPSHPYADLFPVMTGEELAALTADVKAHGLRQAIVLYQGKVLDGRNRLAACGKAGVEPRFEDFDRDDAAALAYVISANIQRRDLTAGQRAVVAARVLQQYGGGWGGDRSSRHLRPAACGSLADGRSVGGGNQVPESGHLNREGVAALFKVGKNYVQEAKALVDDAPDLAEQVAGGALLLEKAYTVLQSRRQEQRAREMREQATATAEDARDKAGRASALRQRAAAEPDAEKAARLRAETDTLDAAAEDARKRATGLKSKASRIAGGAVDEPILMGFDTAKETAAFSEAVRENGIPKDRHQEIADIILGKKPSTTGGKPVRTHSDGMADAVRGWWYVEGGQWEKDQEKAEREQAFKSFKRRCRGGDFSNFLIDLAEKAHELTKMEEDALTAARFYDNRKPVLVPGSDLQLSRLGQL